jgi:hypothetical protein
VEHEPTGVVAAQLRSQAAGAWLVVGPDADVVQVDLVLDRHQADGAERLAQRGQQPRQLGHRRVEGPVVGAVDAGQLEQAGQQLYQLLAPFADLLRQLAVLAGAGAAEGTSEARLRPIEFIHGGLSGGGAPAP